MTSFHHFHQNQAQQKANKSKFATDSFSLSGLLQYAETAKKSSFEALCHLQPLVKTYRDKVMATSQAMIQAESSLGGDAEIPADYAAALNLVKESFKTHLDSLEEWMTALTQKNEPHSDKAIGSVQQSGKQLEKALEGLKVPQ